MKEYPLYISLHDELNPYRVENFNRLYEDIESLLRLDRSVILDYKKIPKTKTKKFHQKVHLRLYAMFGTEKVDSLVENMNMSKPIKNELKFFGRHAGINLDHIK